jgi:hypothetical protein
MNSSAKRWALALALVVLGGACGLVFYMADQGADSEQTEQEPPWVNLSAGLPEDITALSWAWEEQTVNLSAADTGWVDAQDESCPLDEDKIQPLLGAVSDLSAQVVERQVEDFAPYGLDKPTATVMAATADHIVTYQIGAKAGDGGYYLRLDDGQTVYWVSGSFVQTFQVGLTDLVSQALLPEDIDSITALTVQAAGDDYALVYDPDSDDTYYGDRYTWFHQTEEETTPVDGAQAQSLCALVTDMEVLSLVTWQDEEGDSYGFSQPQAVVTVDYTTAQGQTEQLSLEFGSYGTDTVYVRQADSALVYAVPAWVLDGLLYPDWTAMTPLDVFPLDGAVITRAVVTLDGHTFDIARYQETVEPAQEGEEPTVDVIYSASGWVLDTAQTQAWLDAVAGLQAEGVASETQGREELLTVELYVSGEETAAVSLSIFRYDSTRCLCAVGQERAFFLSRETAESLVTQAEALLLPE